MSPAPKRPNANPSSTTRHETLPAADRRDFLKTGSALAAFAILPSGTRLSMLNSKLRTAHIGVGGMGASDLSSVASHKSVEVTALSDVDANKLKTAAQKHGNAQTFSDYREMLAELADKIDGVVVSTPDHTHAPAAMSAMKLGKHVYCQKPLTHEVYEARQLRAVARAKKLKTQMGIQIHSHQVYRKAVRMIQSGVIGKVAEVHAWSNKNWGYDGPAFANTKAAPEYLDWNLWLGPAEKRDFVPGVYHPANWRKIVDFGTGTLGDMGVHIFDTPYAALKLTAPKWAKTTCRLPTGVGHPERNIVAYEFPKTQYTADKLMWTWYDGRNAPPDPKKFKMPIGTKLPGQASLFIGEGGMMLLPHIGEPVLFPDSKFADYKPPRIVGRNHYHQWVEACLGEGQCSAPFSYGGPLTEALLLGVVANRFPGEKLQWEAKEMKITDNEKATALVRRKYRQGFEVEGL